MSKTLRVIMMFIMKITIKIDSISKKVIFPLQTQAKVKSGEVARSTD